MNHRFFSSLGRVASKVLVGTALFVFACGESSEGARPSPSQDAGTSKDGAPLADSGSPPDAEADGGLLAPTCPKDAPIVDLEALRLESTRRYRALLGAGSGYDTGKFYFREFVTNAELFGGPAYDHSAIVFVPDQDPPADKLPTTGLPNGMKPAIVWGLNGIGHAAFTKTTATVEVGVEQSIPVDVLLLPKQGLSDAEIANRFDDLRARFGAHGAVWQNLQAVGILSFNYGDTDGVTTFDATLALRYQQTLDLVAYAKSLTDIETIEFSRYNYIVPFHEQPTVQLPSVPSKIAPECLRTTSAYFRDYPGAFATKPSSPQPFGQGFVPNENPKFESECFVGGVVNRQCWSDKRRAAGY